MGLKNVGRPGEKKPDRFAMADIALETEGYTKPDPYRAPSTDPKPDPKTTPVKFEPSPETTISRKLTAALTEENETQLGEITRHLMERGIRPKDAQIIRLAIKHLSEMPPEQLAQQYDAMPPIKTGPTAKN